MAAASDAAKAALIASSSESNGIDGAVDTEAELQLTLHDPDDAHSPCRRRSMPASESGSEDLVDFEAAEHEHEQRAEDGSHGSANVSPHTNDKASSSHSRPLPSASPSVERRASFSVSQSYNSDSFRAAIVPITVAPITRANQDDVIVGIAHHHVDLEPMFYEADLASYHPRSHAHSDSEVDDNASVVSVDSDASIHDREVSGILSRSSHSVSLAHYQPHHDRQMIAAIRAEKDKSLSAAVIPTESSTSIAKKAAKMDMLLLSSQTSSLSLDSQPHEFSYQPPNQLGDSASESQAVVKVSHNEDYRLPSVSSQSSTSSIPAHSSSTYRSRKRASQCLAVCHFLSSYMSSLFMFSTVLILMKLFPRTLLPASLFGLCDAVIRHTAVIPVQWFTARVSPLSSALFGLISEHALIAAASLLLHFTFTITEYRSEPLLYLLLFAIIVCGMGARLGSLVSRQSLYTDFTRRLYQRTSEEEAVNAHTARLRKAESVSAILAPVTFGVVDTYGDTDIAVLVVAIAALSTVALSIIGVHAANARAVQASRKSSSQPSTPTMLIKAATLQQLSSPTALHTFGSSPSSLFSHPALVPCVAYALLSASILTFGVSMIAFLATVDVSDFAIACGLSAQALLAVVPRMLADIVNRRANVSAETAGVAAIWLQCLLLSPMPVIFFLTDRHSVQSFIVPLFVSLCLASIASSTFTAIEQPWIHATNSSMTESLDDSLSLVPWTFRALIVVGTLVSFALTMIFFDPSLIMAPVAISYACLLLASLLLTFHAFRAPAYQHLNKHADTEMMIVQQVGHASASDEMDVHSHIEHRMDDD